jgi:hypothetical protein
MDLLDRRVLAQPGELGTKPVKLRVADRFFGVDHVFESSEDVIELLTANPVTELLEL